MDGVGTAEEYVTRAKELGMPALAVTDHGTLAGHADFYRACIAGGIAPILGVEAYYTEDRFDRRPKEGRTPDDLIYNHLTVLAGSQTGLRNLHRMSEIAWTEGYFYKPRIDWETLDKYGSGLLIGSACLSGPLCKAIERGNLAEAKAIATKFRSRFGERFFIEVMPHNSPEMNKALLDIADALGIRAAVTPDCHHAHPEHRELQEFALILGTHQKPIKDHSYTASKSYTKMMDRLDYLYGADRPMSFRNFDIHLLSYDEMRAAMESQGIDREDIYSNTLFLASLVNEFEIPSNLDLLPVEYASPDRSLRNYAISGLKEKGLTTQEYKDRLDEELNIIKVKGFAPYFLMVRNVTNYAHRQNILMSPGRGSAAGSLVAYALGITNIDPIQYNLLFSRFIDVSRDDWPDIDMDFEDRYREKVKAFVSRKYGHVASIATFLEFGDKSVVRDVSRVLNVPLDRVNVMLKVVHDWDTFVHSRDPVVLKFHEDFPEVLQYATLLHGRIRGTGVHAAGVVASKIPLTDVAPIETRSAGGGDRVPVVAVDMDEAARIGLIKMDFLGLKTLAVIHDTLNAIEDRHGLSIDLNNIPLDDSNVYGMLNSGRTKGVFQCEAGPYTSLIQTMRVNNFDELVASNALVRPGAANTIGKDYIARKNGYDTTTYVHTSMKPYLEDTYGCVLYQEQVMQACVVLGGMNMAEANRVRKIIGKKKDVREFDQYRNQFVGNASRVIGKDTAESLWHDFEAHAGYSFNKSHAVAYSTLSYWTAWLKYHYPLEFFYALLSNEKDKDSVTDYLIEAKHMGIKIKFPHVNKSGINWSIDGDSLRFGLANVKYLSDVSAKRFLDAGPFESYKQLEEFVFTKGSGVNSRSLEALSKVGAANFEDHKVGVDEAKTNAYEFLNLPAFDVAVPEHWNYKMKRASEYTDGDTAVLSGYVRSVKTGKGWALYEAVDPTGTFAFFSKPGSLDIEVGKFYVFVISNKDAIAALDISNGYDESNAIVQYLENSFSDGYVLAASSRKTKTGARMGTVVITSDDECLVSATLFAREFPRIAPKIKAGNTYNFDLGVSRKGGYVLNGIR